MDDYCRLCAKSQPVSDLITLLCSESSTVSLPNKILQYFEIAITKEDTLPKSACVSCRDKVLSIVVFHDQINEAQTLLTSIQTASDIVDTGPDLADYEYEDVQSINENIKDEIKDEDLNYEIKIENESNESWSSSYDLPLRQRYTPKRMKVNLTQRKLAKKRKLLECEDYIWRCTKCTADFETVIQLRDHFEHIHKEPPEYICMDCTKKFMKYEKFKRHVRMHKNKFKYQCNECGKFSCNKYLHERHIVSHSKDERTYICISCGKTFNTRSALHNHKYTHLPQEKPRIYECDICLKILSTGPNLKAHKRIHSGIKQFTCEQCGQTFMQKTNLEHHIISKHTEDNPIICPLCPKVFKNAYRLRRHQTTIHSNNRPFECDRCDKTYRRGNDLKVHQRVHSGELPFPCTYCTKAFRIKKFLEVHIRQHTGERPYSCLDCDHHFANSSNFIKHMKTKHGIHDFKNLTSLNVKTPQLKHISGMTESNAIQR